MAESNDDLALNQWKPKHLQTAIDKPVEIKDDPAASKEDYALQRMNGIIDEVTTTTLNELRELRDNIDNLMRTIQSRNITIQNAFAEHVGFAASTIECKNIIKQTLEKVTKDFSNGMHPIAKTVTIAGNTK